MLSKVGMFCCTVECCPNPYLSTSIPNGFDRAVRKRAEERHAITSQKFNENKLPEPGAGKGQYAKNETSFEEDGIEWNPDCQSIGDNSFNFYCCAARTGTIMGAAAGTVGAGIAVKGSHLAHAAQAGVAVGSGIASALCLYCLITKGCDAFHFFNKRLLWIDLTVDECFPQLNDIPLEDRTMSR